jgi:hypothetical protein
LEIANELANLLQRVAPLQQLIPVAQKKQGRTAAKANCVVRSRSEESSRINDSCRPFLSPFLGFNAAEMLLVVGCMARANLLNGVSGNGGAEYST